MRGWMAGSPVVVECILRISFAFRSSNVKTIHVGPSRFLFLTASSFSLQFWGGVGGW